MAVNWLWGREDGGPDSTVTAYGLEIKPLFSVLVLRFGHGSRDAYHSHAFNCVSWLLTGGLFEQFQDGKGVTYSPSLRPIFTYRTTFHKVDGVKQANWVLSFRGPWATTWRDSSAAGDKTLTHGRKETQP